MDSKKYHHLPADTALKTSQVGPMPPHRYSVFLMNDDYTPMTFVIEVLQHFFGMSYNAANQVMLQVHQQGKAICGVYTADVAETKVVQVNSYARMHQHPLLCKMEEN